MPELPEVETMVRGIRRDCQERVIERIEFVRTNCRPIQVTPSRHFIRKAATGKTITRIWRLAKRIVLELDSGDSLIIEPRMTGLLLVSNPPTTRHRRVVWHFDPTTSRADQLEFWDRRGLGTLGIYTPETLKMLRTRLGPDALEIDLTGWRFCVKSTSREIKVVLLDQQLVAGIGNLYASEILHRAGISPLRPAAKVARSQLVRLAEAAQHILSEAIRYEGSTLSDGTYRNALNQDGGYQGHHRVYQRAGQSCLNCSRASIVRIVQSQRATFYCPACQR